MPLDGLTNPDLLRQDARIDGAWVGADSGATFAVTNPADGSVLARVPDMGVAETRRAIQAAHAAFKPSRWPTTRPTGSRPISTPGTSVGCGGSRRLWSPAWSASTRG